MDQCGFPGPSSFLGDMERTGTHSCLKNCPFCGTGNSHGLGFERRGSTSEQSLPSKPCGRQSALILLWPRREGGISPKPSPRIPPTSLKHIYTITSGYNLATSLPNVRELQTAATPRPPLTAPLRLLFSCILSPCHFHPHTYYRRSGHTGLKPYCGLWAAPAETAVLYTTWVTGCPKQATQQAVASVIGPSKSRHLFSSCILIFI